MALPGPRARYWIAVGPLVRIRAQSLRYVCCSLRPVSLRTSGQLRARTHGARRDRVCSAVQLYSTTLLWTALLTVQTVLLILGSNSFWCAPPHNCPWDSGSVHCTLWSTVRLAICFDSKPICVVSRGRYYKYSFPSSTSYGKRIRTSVAGAPRVHACWSRGLASLIASATPRACVKSCASCKARCSHFQDNFWQDAPSCL